MQSKLCKKGQKIFTSLGCLFNTLWWSPSKKVPKNFMHPISATWQLIGPCGGYEGVFDRSMCTGGRWCHTDKRPKSHFWEWVSGLHTNSSSECSHSQKANRVLGFIKRNIDSKTENNISLLWKNWCSHTTGSWEVKGSPCTPQAQLKKNPVEVTERWRE